MSREQVNAFVARNDAEYILEPVAKLLASGTKKRQAKAALTAAAKRALRLAAQDAGLPMSIVRKEAGCVVRELLY